MRALSVYLVVLDLVIDVAAEGGPLAYDELDLVPVRQAVGHVRQLHSGLE
jgi:hypothetical protein